MASPSPDGAPVLFSIVKHGAGGFFKCSAVILRQKVEPGEKPFRLGRKKPLPLCVCDCCRFLSFLPCLCLRAALEETDQDDSTPFLSRPQFDKGRRNLTLFSDTLTDIPPPCLA